MHSDADQRTALWELVLQVVMEWLRDAGDTFRSYQRRYTMTLVRSGFTGTQISPNTRIVNDISSPSIFRTWCEHCELGLINVLSLGSGRYGTIEVYLLCGTHLVAYSLEWNKDKCDPRVRF